MKYVKVNIKLLSANIENDNFWRKKAEFIYKVLLNKVKNDEFDDDNEIYLDPNEMNIESLNGLCVSFFPTDGNYNVNAEFMSHPPLDITKTLNVKYFTLTIFFTKSINTLSDMHKMLSSSEYRLHIIHEIIHFLDFKERKVKSMNTSDNKLSNSIEEFNSLSDKEKEELQNLRKKYLSHGLELNAYYQSIISNLINRTKRKEVINFLKNPSPDRIKKYSYPGLLLAYLYRTQPQIREILKISNDLKRKFFKRLIPVYEQYFKESVEN